MRDWKTYLDQLPIKANDLILDLGCGAGDVSELLAARREGYWYRTASTPVWGATVGIHCYR